VDLSSTFLAPTGRKMSVQFFVEFLTRARWNLKRSSVSD
jgi:hypothetical protein